MNLLAVLVAFAGVGVLIAFGAPEMLAKVGILKFSTMPIDGAGPETVTQFFRPGHNGVDFGVPIGTPLVCVAPGIVAQVRQDPNNASGKFVIVKGRLPFLPSIAWGYSHMSRIDVTLGQELNPGDQVGLSGNTGDTVGSDGLRVRNRTDGRGAHLHFTVLDVPRNFASLDPEPFLSISIRDEGGLV